MTLINRKVGFLLAPIFKNIDLSKQCRFGSNPLWKDGSQGGLFTNTCIHQLCDWEHIQFLFYLFLKRTYLFILKTERTRDNMS